MALLSDCSQRLCRLPDRSSECVRLLATGLRSFLRFLHAQGEIGNDLTAAIPMVRRWTQPDVPKKLTPEEVSQVLDAPDLETATGRRDYAILLLLARLGLRSSEVLWLELEDLRWRTGELLIRGNSAFVQVKRQLLYYDLIRPTAHSTRELVIGLL